MTTLAAGVLGAVLYGRWHAISGYGDDASQSLSQSGRPAPAAFQSLPASTAGLLGSGEQNAIEYAPDGGIVVAGRVDSADFGLNPTRLLSGGSGTILRLDATGARVRSLTRIGAEVDDLALDPGDGRMSAVGDFGLAELDPLASRVLWSRELGPGGGSADGPGRRVAVGSDGTVAALFDKTVSTFDRSGHLLGRWTLAHSFVNDIAIDGSTGTVFATGFTEDRLRAGQAIQVAFLTAYGYDGSVRWRDFGFSGSDLKSSQADSRGYRVTVGLDAKLYWLAETDAGSSIFQYQPRTWARPRRWFRPMPTTR